MSQGEDFTEVLSRAYSSVTQVLLGLERKSIGDVREDIRSKPAISCVYLFWDSKGLIYVGKTGNLKARLSQHLTRCGGLTQYIAKERGLDLEGFSAHKCQCGRIIKCNCGNEIVRTPGVYGKLRSEIIKSVQVSFMSVLSRPSLYWDSELEKYVQWVLKPRCGRIEAERTEQE